MRLISLLMVLCLLGATEAMGRKLFPVLHGEPTPLQNALSRIKESRLIDGYVWTYADLEVLVQLYPPPSGIRTEDLPPGETLWKYPWVARSDLYAPADVSKGHSREPLPADPSRAGRKDLHDKFAYRRAHTQRGTRCSERLKVEMPCQDVWMQVRELDIVPEAARVEITELFENASGSS
ncbi:MAG TPA: hypothetical protein VN874_05160 [Myxococcales bacterium]|jgi:hypothetical protein|nr:hypothetical protein [Myxococcales bacterium]